VIHLGDRAAVVVPVVDLLRLRALEQTASSEELEDAEDTPAVLAWKARDAAGPTKYVPAGEARRRLGLRSLAPASIISAAASGTSSRQPRSAAVSPPPSWYLMPPA
jgi:hypothetical protein